MEIPNLPEFKNWKMQSLCDIAFVKAKVNGRFTFMSTKIGVKTDLKRGLHKVHAKKSCINS